MQSNKKILIHVTFSNHKIVIYYNICHKIYRRQYHYTKQGRNKRLEIRKEFLFKDGVCNR